MTLIKRFLIIIFAFLMLMPCSEQFNRPFTTNDSFKVARKANHTNSDYKETNVLGYSINGVTDDVLDVYSVNFGNPVFNEDLLNQLPSLTTKITNPETRTKYFNGTSITEIEEAISLFVGATSELSTSIFNVGIGKSLFSGMNLDFSSRVYHDFHIAFSYYRDHMLVIPDISSNYNLYSGNLSSNFIRDLHELMETRDFVPFFDRYGTHVIGSAIYGGSGIMSYGLTSNEYSVGLEFSSEVSLGLEAEIERIINANKNFSFSFESITGVQNSDVLENYSLRTLGGEYFSGISISTFYNNFDEWTKTVKDNLSVIGYGKNGLVPIWTIVPYSYQNSVKTMMLEYAYVKQRIANAIFSYNDYFNKTLTFKTCVREQPQIITDASNVHDEVNFNNFPYSYGSIKNMGYKSFRIEIDFMVKEIDDGYQIGAISNKIEDIPIKQNKGYFDIFEHGKGYLDELYGPGKWKFPYHPIVDMSINNVFKFYIRYGAEGWEDDDWYIDDVWVTIVFSKDEN